MSPAARRRLALVFLGVLLTYNLSTLGRVPAFLNDDDGAYASAAYQFWRTGKPGVPGYRDVVDLGRDVRVYGRTAAAVQGVFLRLAGVSIFAALLPSFLVGLALLAFTTALGRCLWDASTGLLAALLLAASGKFFEACRWARPDILLALYFLLALWLAASASGPRPARRLFLSGLVMGLAGDVHLNGFLIAPLPLLFWLLLRPQSKKVRIRAALAFAGAASLGVLLWLALHYWPDPVGFRRQFAVHGGATHGLRFATLGLWGAVEAEMRRYTDWFWAARGHRHLLEGLSIAGAAAFMLLRPNPPGRALVLVWIAFFCVAVAFMSNPFGWYLIVAWPLFALWMARAFLTLPARSLARLGLAALMAAYLLNLGLWHFKARSDEPLQPRLAQLRRLVPAGSPVLANGALWFAFWDRDFTDQSYLEFRRLESRLDPASGPTGWAEEQRNRGWQYIAAFGDLRRFLDPEIPLNEVLSADTRGRADLIQQARAFSLARCSVEQRIPGVADSILILRIHDGISSRP